MNPGLNASFGEQENLVFRKAAHMLECLDDDGLGES